MTQMADGDEYRVWARRERDIVHAVSPHNDSTVCQPARDPITDAETDPLGQDPDVIVPASQVSDRAWALVDAYDLACSMCSRALDNASPDVDAENFDFTFTCPECGETFASFKVILGGIGIHDTDGKGKCQFAVETVLDDLWGEFDPGDSGGGDE